MMALFFIIALLVAGPAMAQQSQQQPRFNPWDSVLKGQMAEQNLQQAYREGLNRSQPFQSGPSYPVCRSSMMPNTMTGGVMVCRVCYYENGPPTFSCF